MHFIAHISSSSIGLACACGFYYHRSLSRLQRVICTTIHLTFLEVDGKDGTFFQHLRFKDYLKSSGKAVP